MQFFPFLTNCVFPYKIKLKISQALLTYKRAKGLFSLLKKIKFIDTSNGNDKYPGDSFKTLELVATFGDLMVNSFTIQVTPFDSLT